MSEARGRYAVSALLDRQQAQGQAWLRVVLACKEQGHVTILKCSEDGSYTLILILHIGWQQHIAKLKLPTPCTCMLQDEEGHVPKKAVRTQG